MSYVIGIDPGNGGGLALLCGRAHVFSCCMPLIAAGKKSSKRTIDTHQAARILRGWVADAGGDIRAVIEDVHAMPGQGVTSMFTFGRGLGRIEGIIVTLGISMIYVTPAKWKAHYRLGADKEQARLLAQQLYPDAPLGRVKDDGVAEALLIARYGAEIG